MVKCLIEINFMLFAMVTYVMFTLNLEDSTVKQTSATDDTHIRFTVKLLFALSLTHVTGVCLTYVDFA